MFTLEQILEGTRGHLDEADGVTAMHEFGFSAAEIDSRKDLGGALFVALRGERFDGHDFVLDAIEHGASGALVRADWQAPAAFPHGIPLIRVEDPLTALQRLAAWWRARHDVQVIGITGSVGKTSTKEVTASLLSRQFPTLKSEGNLNNEIGLPMTLLQLTDEHRKAVLEMGAGYALGELTMLCEIARPEIAIVTMVQPVHLERMGTIENIALNKSELVRALPPTGTAVLNGDDHRVLAMREVTPARLLRYGLHADSDLQATDIESRGLQGVRFTMRFHPEQRGWLVHLPLMGRHNVYTALAAAGAAYAAGMSWDAIIKGLEALDAQVRLLVVPGYNGSTLLDDSYNASPASMLAALDLLEELPGRHIAVLGDMLELGSYEQEGHIGVARRAREVAHVFVALGSLGRFMGEVAQRGGMPAERVFLAADNEQVIAYLKGALQPGDHVLVKGSRGLHMEDIVEGLKA